MKTNDELLTRTFDKLAKSNMLLQKAIEEKNIENILQYISKRDALLSFINGLPNKNGHVFNHWLDIINKAANLNETALVLLQEEKNKVKKSINQTKVSQNQVSNYDLRSVK